MNAKNVKICLLLAGGSTISDKDILGSTVNSQSDIKKWLELVPEIFLMAQIEPVFICADNGLIGIKLWQQIAQTVFIRADEFDGFVILTNLESVLYAGIALSFTLKNINKPVILTSSQITEVNVKLADWPAKKAKAYGGLGVKANLINAVQLATMKLPAVALMFGNRIIRAVKARRVGFLGLNIFASADESYLGRIDFGISLTEKFSVINTPLELKDKFEPRIKIYNYFPGADFIDLKKDSAKGKLIKNLPDIRLFDKYAGQAPLAVYNRFLFEQAEQENILIINQLTWETAVVKFMWALGQSNSIAEVRGFMFNEHCHEFIR